MSWQTSYTETRLRLGAGPSLRPGSTLCVVSLWLSLSLSVPGRHLKKRGRLPSPSALSSHSRVATKRRVGFRSPAFHTRVATGRAERDAPTPIFFLVVFLLLLLLLFLSSTQQSPIPIPHPPPLTSPNTPPPPHSNRPAPPIPPGTPAQIPLPPPPPPLRK